MTSTTHPTFEHPIQWTKESASSCFPVPIRQTKDLPIGELFEDLHPKWLTGGVKLEQAIRQACKDHTPDVDLQWAKENLHRRQTMKTWHGENMEDHISSFCTTWLKGLNEPRALRRYRNRSV